MADNDLYTFDKKGTERIVNATRRVEATPLGSSPGRRGRGREDQMVGRITAVGDSDGYYDVEQVVWNGSAWATVTGGLVWDGESGNLPEMYEVNGDLTIADLLALGNDVYVFPYLFGASDGTFQWVFQSSTGAALIHPFKVTRTDDTHVAVGSHRSDNVVKDYIHLYDGETGTMITYNFASSENQAISAETYLYYKLYISGGVIVPTLETNATWPLTDTAEFIYLLIAHITFADGAIVGIGQELFDCPVLYPRPILTNDGPIYIAGAGKQVRIPARYVHTPWGSGQVGSLDTDLVGTSDVWVQFTVAADSTFSLTGTYQLGAYTEATDFINTTGGTTTVKIKVGEITATRYKPVLKGDIDFLGGVPPGTLDGDTLSWVDSTKEWVSNSILQVLGAEVHVRQDAGADKMILLHDGSNPYIKWNTGNLKLVTDEGVNTNTLVEIHGKGTGHGVLILNDEDDSETLQLFVSNGVGDISVQGTAAGLKIQDDGECDITLFAGVSAGKYPQLHISGRDSGNNPITATIGIPGGEADTLGISGMDMLRIFSNANIGGEVKISDEYFLPTTDGAADQVLTTDGAGQASWSDAANKVKVSVDDTTPGYLLGKIPCDLPLIATETGGGGNETLVLSMDISQLGASSPATNHLVLMEASAGSQYKVTFQNFFSAMIALGTLTTPDSATDYMIVHDATDSTAKKMLLEKVAFDPTVYAGYDAGKTQSLFHVSGTLTWQDVSTWP